LFAFARATVQPVGARLMNNKTNNNNASAAADKTAQTEQCDTAQHSPLPWWIKQTPQSDKYPDLHDNLIMAKYGTSNQDCVVATVDNADEDAAFIVHACNNVERLAEALRKAETGLRESVAIINHNHPTWNSLFELLGEIKSVNTRE
jgi:hypothetical protein